MCRGLVKLYILSMRLPSKYLRQRVVYEGNREIREFDDLAGRLETLRREVYMMVERIFAYVEEFGTWIAVTDEAVEEARGISSYVVERLRELGLDGVAGRYSVKAVAAYLEPDDAREILSKAIASLSRDVSELRRRIAEAEKERKKTVYRLERELTDKQRLLKLFVGYLSQFG